MAYPGDVRTTPRHSDLHGGPSLELLISDDDPGRCPPQEEIWNAGAHDVDVVKTRRLIAHLSGCPTCFRSWRVARAMRRRDLPEPAADGYAESDARL